MTPEFVTDTLINALWLALMVASPMLLLGLITGVLISIIQAATQIQEMTLTFIPKIIMVILGLMYALPWMIQKMTTFTVNLLERLPMVVR